MNKGATVKERGAVSLFIVIFTALLVTVVTTSFVQIMLRNQQQATDNDLSQSAYDSAMAGVEDAKRALVRLKKCQPDPTQPGCVALIGAFSNADSDCEFLESVGVTDFVNGEVQVGNDASLNQAYTCVNVNVDTRSFNGVLFANQGVVVPLVPVGGDTNAIESVRISWFSRAKHDVADTVDATLPTEIRLEKNNFDWGINVPPMMRAQLMQFNKGTVSLADFDGENARTRFLYPFAGGMGFDNFALDTRDRTASTGNSPKPGGCVTNFTLQGEYACSVIVELPDLPIDQTREAYLFLSGIYVQTPGVHYMVEMLDGAGVGANNIYFNNVQPEVDATGRASDLFRRVKATVDVSESGRPTNYPTAALSTENLCKEFFITSAKADYDSDGNKNDGGCTP